MDSLVQISRLGEKDKMVSNQKYFENIGENAEQIENCNARINLAIDWLIRSDIYNRSPKSISYGGFNEKYDLRINSSYSFAYSEITGYAINLLVYLFRQNRIEEFLDICQNGS